MWFDGAASLDAPTHGKATRDTELNKNHPSASPVCLTQFPVLQREIVMLMSEAINHQRFQ
jgi:hypothetical protein